MQLISDTSTQWLVCREIILEYFEELPNGCPPNYAEESNLDGYRLVHNNPPTIDDFKSLASLGRPTPPTVDSCKWASCSISPDKERAKALAKLPKFRSKNTYFAKMEAAAGIGRLHKTVSHIDLWMYQNINPIDFVTGVEEVGEP